MARQTVKNNAIEWHLRRVLLDAGTFEEPIKRPTAALACAVAGRLDERDGRLLEPADWLGLARVLRLCLRDLGLVPAPEPAAEASEALRVWEDLIEAAAVVAKGEAVVKIPPEFAPDSIAEAVEGSIVAAIEAGRIVPAQAATVALARETARRMSGPLTTHAQYSPLARTLAACLRDLGISGSEPEPGPSEADKLDALLSALS
jgi:hypothetical protein